MNTNKSNNYLNIQKIPSDKNRKDWAATLYKIAMAGFKNESPWETQHFYHTLEAENVVVFTASINEHSKEKTIGFLIASIALSEVDIYMIVVDEDYKQGHIAYQLFEHLIEYCRKREVETLYLEVRVSNVPAIGLYKKIGFEEIALRKAYYSKPIEDAIVMQLNI